VLAYLIKKYKENDVDGIVYRLTYAGKFIIVKGRTLCGSLIIISNTFDQYKADAKRFKGHLYRHLYDHYLANKEIGRFRIKTLAKVSSKIDHYKLLKREQMELDKSRYVPECLNNSLEAYIPIYNDTTDMFGWLPRSTVMNFKRYLDSKERQAYIKRYSKKPEPTPAMSDL
jgi:hypothetical protein